MDTLNELPIRVSRAVVDAWNIRPPCEYNEPFCHPHCPYWHECNGDDEEDE